MDEVKCVIFHIYTLINHLDRMVSLLYFIRNVGILRARVYRRLQHLFFKSTGKMDPFLNHNFLARIPKCKKPHDYSGLQPTSLCNVLYKLVTEVIANRLKPIMNFGHLIIPKGFLAGRLLMDNTLIVLETCSAISNLWHL